MGQASQTRHAGTGRTQKSRHTALRSVVAYLPLGSIVADPSNPRLHTSAQIDAIARSIEAFGFNAPILLDKANRIVAGHGRLEAAKRLGLTEVPAIRLEHLSEHQAKAYMLADNKLTDRSSWDDRKVAIVLKELSEIALDFEIEATGFEPPEIDLRIQSLEPPEESADSADEFDVPEGPPVSWATTTFSAATPSIRGPMTHSSLERKPPPLSRIRRTMSG
jgi:hypothetical protein